MKKLRAISLWRWWSGVGFGLLVLAARLPDCVVVVRDAQGHSTGQTRYDPFGTVWTIAYITIAVACILFGGRIALVIGFGMLVLGLFGR
jgi:hypothetical protein